MSTVHHCQAREFPPEWQFREEQQIISAFATVNPQASTASDIPDTESILQGEVLNEVLQNVTTMRDILPSPVRRIVASLSFEPCHDDITGITDALAAMPPPSAIDTLDDVDKPDTVPAPVLPVIFVSDSDDTYQPSDVEPDDASPVVSQASAMADAHQSVVIISSVASTTSVVPVITGSSSFTPPRVVRGSVNKPHPRRRPPPRALPPGVGIGRKDIRSEFFADLEASLWPPVATPNRQSC